jgi:hypothetical protein
MAALIGYLEYGHHAGLVHRLAHKVIESELRTWDGRINTTLLKDGTYFVSVNGKDVANGNVNKK